MFLMIKLNSILVQISIEQINIPNPFDISNVSNASNVANANC
jgi:hypothetical protein